MYTTKKMVRQFDIIYYAQNQAIKSPMKKQYGCIIVHRNTIVGAGFNYCTSGQQKSRVL